MYVLGNLRTSNSWQVKIPVYHRGHLSLYPGTTLHMAFVAGSKTGESFGTAPVFPEIFGTPIKRTAWRTIYRASLALYDAPGVVHKTLKAITDHGGSILQLDSTSTDQEVHHNVEVFIDFRLWHPSSDPMVDLSQLIEGLLIAECGSHIVSDKQRGYRLRVRPVMSLRRMAELVSIRSLDDYEAKVQPDGALHFDANWHEQIPTPFQYFVTSDTKDRVLRITMIPSGWNRSVVWCVIAHTGAARSLSDITAAFQENHITILSALNRVHRHQGRSWFETIISKPDWHVEPISAGATAPPPAIQDEIRRILGQGPFRSGAISVFFDRSSARAAMNALPSGSHAASHSAWPPSSSPMKRWIDDPKNAEWLRAKEGELLSTARPSEPWPRRRPTDPRQRKLDDDAVRRRRALEIGVEKVRNAVGQPGSQLFLSIEFTPANAELIELAKACCAEADLRCVIVDGSVERARVRDEVRCQIRSASYFVGVWTPSAKEATSKREKSRPSPWCLWELGIADAYEIPFRVLIEDKTSFVDYEYIVRDLFFEKFVRSGSIPPPSSAPTSRSPRGDVKRLFETFVRVTRRSIFPGATPSDVPRDFKEGMTRAIRFLISQRAPHLAT